ncbi:MAG TPA: MBL fold metallo-hydrolase [Kofleriaceae bacterium]|nr:MBL fold metallo-hydrolase [Kofleriaceae bacterium]
MAKLARRHPGNAPGPWYVDDSCIDCDASRQCAPELFADVDGQSVVVRQPVTAEEIDQAARAMLICPTGSIGTTGPRPALDRLFPHELDGGVYVCGFNSPDSFGANSFLARRAEGNLLVDSPRFVTRLVRSIEELGGVSEILLTHRDDVADAGKWAAHFGARAWIHEEEAAAAPFATGRIRGVEPLEIRAGLRAIPVPGHTRGSVVFHLDDRFLFTGDSMHYSRGLGELSAFRSVCWYSWPELTRSLERLEPLRFEWVLAGHGDRHHAPAAWMQASLRRLVARMQADDAWDEAW